MRLKLSIKVNIDRSRIWNILRYFRLPVCSIRGCLRYGQMTEQITDNDEVEWKRTCETCQDELDNYYASRIEDYETNFSNIDPTVTITD